MFEIQENRDLIYFFQKQTKDCWVQRIKNTNKMLYSYIAISYNGRSWSEKAYLFCNNLGFEQLKCDCGREIKYYGLLVGYKKCKSCAARSEEKHKALQATLFQKYGVVNVYDVPGYREKRKATISTSEWKQQHGNKIKRGMADKGISIPAEKTTDWKKYKLAVRRFTNKQPIKILENFDQRGQGLGKMNLDHIVFVFDGFMNNIPRHLSLDRSII
jgi:hypothetical protein